MDTITKIDPAKACPFVGEVLRRLRAEVGNDATVLGFVGLPFTLATYLVEGKSSQEYLEIKKLAHNEPKVSPNSRGRLRTTPGLARCALLMSFLFC